MNQNLELLLLKLSSGRYVLTLVASLIFAYCSCNQIIEPKDTIMLLGVIITSYFTRDRNNDTPTVDKNTPKP